MSKKIIAVLCSAAFGVATAFAGDVLAEGDDSTRTVTTESTSANDCSTTDSLLADLTTEADVLMSSDCYSRCTDGCFQRYPSGGSPLQACIRSCDYKCSGDPA